ncbi:beta-propeller domain-containing protein [Actinocorallia sp. A-T 12471]|uniref:beta-propeller domain-containing protein n=1 Tax=Actinocorallia sp. A-T 12471 TaxID=3089813 RepID=UPI0029D0A407|nr:beta-propeller domain-containing protein [Actinocorallia sp. A-T 12471]MDX6739084.1 beta-propeller domain-containing protein [Actinocorallia sp. A-T 12471]
MMTPVVLLLATACSVSAADTSPGLHSRQDCAALLDSLRSAAVERTGPLGLVPGGPDPGPPPALEVPAYDPSTSDVDLPDQVARSGPQVLFVSGRTLLVLRARDGSVQRRLRLPKGYESARVVTDGRRALLLADHDPDGAEPATPSARVLTVDLSAFRITGELRMPGSLADARRAGPLVRVSVRALPRLEFPAPPPPRERASPDFAPRARQHNRDIVREAPAEAFHPSYDVTSGGETTRHKVPCQRINRPVGDRASSVLTVFTFDLSRPIGDASPVAIAGGPATVHGTAAHLFVAESDPASVTTRVHRLDLTRPRPLYVGSGSVTGEILDGEAMSEHDGYLRLAVGDPDRTQGDLYILETDGPVLDPVGKLTDISGDNGIRSVTFLGARAYVTTTRAQGPLPALDLANPYKPRRDGDVAFPAASTRLLPSSDGRFLAVGQPRTGRGTPRGLRVSLFEPGPGKHVRLADFRRPGMPGARVEDDPYAYWHDAASGVTVLPTVPNGAVVLSVTRDAGIRQLGRISHRPSSTGVYRALLVDDALWTFSSEGVMVHDARTLKRRAWTAL